MMADDCKCDHCRIRRIEEKVDAIFTLLNVVFHDHAVDLQILFGHAATPPTKGQTPMANKKASGPAVKLPCLAPKSAKPKAVMPDVTLTDPAPSSITLQPLNAAGGVVVLTPADSVTGTLTSDSANFVITAGADATHFTGTIPANTPQGSIANLAATLKGTIAGAAADLSASVKVIIDLPAVPVATDLAIVFG